MGALSTAVVVVEAPAECASIASFSAALTAGSSRVRSGAGADRIEVRAAPRPEGGAEGAVTIVRGGLRSDERRVEGASCAEVVDGLALVTALAWDAAPEPEATPEPHASPSSASHPAPRIDLPAAPDALPRRATRSRWSLGVAPSAGTMALGTDRAVVAWGGFVDLERTGGGFAPALRVGASHATSEASVYGISETLAWTYARVQACPVAGVLGTFSVRPCAQADLGVLYASSRNTQRDATRGWAAPGLAARITWRSALGMFVEVDPSFAMAATRPTLLSGGLGFSQYRAPLALPGLEIALGYRFF